jgi:excisionase family DNA binding protein
MAAMRYIGRCLATLPTVDEGEDMLSVAEAVKLLKVHEETVRRWLRNGTIRGERMHGTGRYRIPRSEVRRMLGLSGAPGGERA